MTQPVMRSLGGVGLGLLCKGRFPMLIPSHGHGVVEICYECAPMAMWVVSSPIGLCVLNAVNVVGN